LRSPFSIGYMVVPEAISALRSCPTLL
jgi:hypothetical protein